MDGVVLLDLLPEVQALEGWAAAAATIRIMTWSAAEVATWDIVLAEQLVNSGKLKC